MGRLPPWATGRSSGHGSTADPRPVFLLSPAGLDRDRPVVDLSALWRGVGLVMTDGGLLFNMVDVALALIVLLGWLAWLMSRKP